MIESLLVILSCSIAGCLTLLVIMRNESSSHLSIAYYDKEPTFTWTKITEFKPKPTKKTKTIGVQSPSKHMTLNQLKKIKADNYQGNKHEYFEEEIEEEIIKKSQSHADNKLIEMVNKLTLNDINF